MPLTPMPPPQGISDFDFETIEDAVNETVRGRWFLAEFARRNRSAESKATLDAITRLETLVTSSQIAVPPAADPSVRLLIQRIKDIACQLDGVSRDMRLGGVSDDLCDAIDGQARALAGLMRVGPKMAPVEPARRDRLAPLTPPEPTALAIAKVKTSRSVDPRLAVLSRLDGLSLAEKLALFA